MGKLDISKVEEDYLYRVLEMMQSKGLIEGLQFKKAWEGAVILINDLDDISITSDGIHYLLENSRMKKVKDFFIRSDGCDSKFNSISLYCRLAFNRFSGWVLFLYSNLRRWCSY